MPVRRVKGHARVAVREFAVADLEPAPYNPRKISHQAQAALSASLDRFGLLSLPVVNLAGDRPRIVGGHQRIESLRKSGITRVQCVVVEFDDETEKRANIALNNPHAQGDFIADTVRALVKQIAHVPELSAVCKAVNVDGLLAELNRNLRSPVDDVEDTRPDNADTVPVETLKAQSRKGNTYVCGKSLLVCGAFDAKTVQGLIFEGQAFLAAGTPHHEAVTACTSGAVYTAASGANLIERLAWWQTAAPTLKLSRLCCFYRDGAVVTPGVPLAQAATTLCYGWVAGKERVYLGGSGTPTACKVRSPGCGFDIMSWVLLLSVEPGEWLTVDQSQQGAELLAAHDTGRRVITFADPVQCDVARKRWAAYTGAASWQEASPIHK